MKLTFKAKTLIATLLLSLGTVALAKTPQKTTRHYAPPPSETIRCLLGVGEDKNFLGNPPDLFLCTINSKQYMARSDAELNTLLEKLGYVVTKITKASFNQYEKSILLEVAR